MANLCPVDKLPCSDPHCVAGCDRTRPRRPIKCLTCDNRAKPGERMCASCLDVDWYALSNGLDTVMPDGTLVHGVDDADT